METPYVEHAINRVLETVKTVKKAELARRAGVPESTLRGMGEPDWKPNAATLEKLELASIEIERERADAAEDPPAGSA